jgi:ABC-2 type transport system permease protein
VIDLTLLRLLTVRRAQFLALCGFFLGGFQYLICAAVGSADVGGALQTLVQSLPPFVQDLVASQFLGGLSERGLLAFGWNHPISHALGTAAAIVLGSRAVAGESESGALELLASQPLSRGRYLRTQVVFAFVALALVSLVGIAGTTAGMRVQHLEPFGGSQLLRLGSNFYLLLCAWYAISLVLSVIGREGGRVAGIAFLVALLSYIGQAIGRMWKAAAFVLPWSLHDYFAPQTLLLGTASVVRPLVTLFAVTVAGVSLAAWRYQRRDLP